MGGLVRSWTLKKHSHKEVEEEEAKVTKRKKRSREVVASGGDSVKKAIIKSLDEEEEKSIYLYIEGLGSSPPPPQLCRIPPMWLCYDIQNSPKVPSLYKAFNHHLHHKDQPSFTFPDFMPLSINNASKLHDSGMGHSTCAVMGSTFYFFGCASKDPARFRGIYYLRKDCISSFYPNSIYGKKRAVRRAGCMVNAREKPVVVSLDGKAYIFGGKEDYEFTPTADEEKERAKFKWAEVFEPYEGSLKGRCRALTLPSEECNNTPHCAVAVEKAKKIIVCWAWGWGEGDTYEYDIVKEAWLKIDIQYLSHCICLPVVVDGILYWLYDGMFAYDVEEKLLINGPFEDNLIQTLYTKEIKVLFHLAGDFFCILWSEPLEKREVMHCTIVRVVRDANNNKTPRLRIIVESCQTFYCLFKLNLSLLHHSVFMV